MSDEHSFWARKETERAIGVIFLLERMTARQTGSLALDT